MIALIQRVTNAKVDVAGKTVGANRRWLAGFARGRKRRR